MRTLAIDALAFAGPIPVRWRSCFLLAVAPNAKAVVDARVVDRRQRAVGTPCGRTIARKIVG
jgi:hypothetical protein